MGKALHATPLHCLLLLLTATLCAPAFAQDLTVCAGKGYTLNSAADAVGASGGVTYTWYENGNPVENSNTASISFPNGKDTGGTYYYSRKASNAACSEGVFSNTYTVVVYGAVSPGSITTASTAVDAGTAPNVTIQSDEAATGGSGNLTYMWVRTGTSTSAATLTASDATYAINDDASNYATAGTYYFNRYAKDATCNTAWVAASGTYTLEVSSCRPFTQPVLAGTFVDFSGTYGASTYVTLTDERDSKNYTVVKIGGRWIMAQNLNYQEGLTWEANSNSPSTYYTSACTACIGHFWCPGGYSSSAATSTKESCDVWGALYSWETAMMLDGKWTSSAKSSSAWTERTGYGTTSSANTQNHGQSDAGATTGGRGICPPNWHVPSDGEWGDVLNDMETGTKNHNQSTGWRGIAAGSRGRSKCTVADKSTAGNTYVNDTQANWYYCSGRVGTDNYGFGVVPAGRRNHDGSAFSARGLYAHFWSATARDNSAAWHRYYGCDALDVYRYYLDRSYGFSVRCIKN